MRSILTALPDIPGDMDEIGVWALLQERANRPVETPRIQAFQTGKKRFQRHPVLMAEDDPAILLETVDKLVVANRYTQVFAPVIQVHPY